MPHWTSSIISSQSFASQSVRSAFRYSTRAGATPPSPWIASMKTATTFGRSAATRSTAAMSFSGTRTKPGTSGSKPFCTFALPVADNVAIERPWNALS